MKKISGILIVSLVVGLIYTSTELKKLNVKYSVSIENLKAYDNNFNALSEENRVLKLTKEQLNYFKDSILIKMNDVRKELKIKDSKIKQMQYELSNIEKSDSIQVYDTIFINPSFKLDTIFGDKWVNNHLVLKYPNHIKNTVGVHLERFLYVTSKRETINPPKKFFLFRWFQKKHTVATIIVKENNPYVKNKEQRFVEIIE